MAQFDVYRNRRGYDGGRQLAAIVGYSASKESYMASREEVVTFSDNPVRPDLHDQVWPRSSAYIKPKQIDEYGSPPNHTRTSGSPRDSPRKAFHRAKSPPTGHYYGPHLVAPQESPRSPKFNHTNGSPHDSPRKPFHGANSPSAGQYPNKYGGPHDSPRNNFRDHRGGFSNNDDDSSDDDDEECRDGVCYPKPKHGGGPQGYVDYDKEKKKGNGYAAGNYPLQHYPTDHQASDGQNIYGSHSYNAPAHTKPTTDAYYDRFSYPTDQNNYTRPNTEPYAVPAPIKTRPDRRDAGKSSPVSAAPQWTPFASSPPRKGHQGKPDMINSKEAQRRYGNVPPQSGPAADRKYRTAIDCEEAARKYGGVFVKGLET